MVLRAQADGCCASLAQQGRFHGRTAPQPYESTKELSIGPHARLKVVKRIVRCAATNVDPLTGIRDLNIPKALMRGLGHGDCGIYAEVTAAGEIAAGDEIEII